MNKAQNAVVIVFTDEVEILARRTIGGDVDAQLLALNADESGKARWRRAITYREPLNTVCGACGTRRCWCGVNRLRSRTQEARR